LILYHSTNGPSWRQVDLVTALLEGLAPDYGLYTPRRKDLPRFTKRQLKSMKGMPYADIAFMVLWPFLQGSIPRNKAEELVHQAYDERVITTRMQKVLDDLWIMWLTGGPSLSFKDYAALLYAVLLDFILSLEDLYRLIFVATSGDTGAAIAGAVRYLKRLALVIFYPLGEITHLQRLQMETIGENVFAIGYKGDFDLGQEMAKRFLRDQRFCKELFGRPDWFTSANSISVGRLLPQMVYPFYAHSQLDEWPFIASVPSGNFGDMMGTLLAREMGLPIDKILCGVNGNDTFPRFLNSGTYNPGSTHRSPSSAMNVARPSNVARLFDFFGGQIFDERDPITGEVTQKDIIVQGPDRLLMLRPLWSVSVSDEEHYDTMRRVYQKHGVILDPHGAVSWRTAERYREGRGFTPKVVVYETADPAKFPEDVHKAIGLYPPVPDALAQLEEMPRRTIELQSEPDRGADGKLTPSQAQMDEAKELLRKISFFNT